MAKVVVRAAFLFSGIILLSVALAAIAFPCRETIIPAVEVLSPLP